VHAESGEFSKSRDNEREKEKEAKNRIKKRTKGRKYTKWIIDDANPPTH
jgi:hypothetical protein